MKRTKMRGEGEGIYGVYWKQVDSGNGIDTEVVYPDPDETPESVKLMILDQLLKDLEIPISIDEYKLRRIVK